MENNMNTFFLLMVFAVLVVPALHACPSVCSCTDGRVSCVGQNLKTIPHDLPQDATYIDLQSNDIKTVEDQFQNLTSVIEIHLRFNQITHIADGAFVNLTNLQRLNLASNRLTTLTPALFKDLPEISVLDLSQNQLSEIDGAFEELENLSKLVLTRNKLTTLTNSTLKPLTNLVYFLADGNNISYIEPGTFDSLKALSYVMLGSNPLDDMDDRFSSNEMLSFVDLSDCRLPTVPRGLPWMVRFMKLQKNRITKISSRTFSAIRYLAVIILDENNITQIEHGAFAPLPHLQEIWLNGNGLSVFPSPIPPSVTTLNAEQNNIAAVTNDDFPENSKLKLLSLRGNTLKEIGPYTFGNLKELQKLYLGNNAITELKDTAFSGLRNLTDLELDRNPITHIETRFAAGLRNLKSLDLSYIEDTEPLIKGNFFRDVPFLQTLKLRSSPTLAKNILTSQETLTSFYNLKALDVRDNFLQSVDVDLPRFFHNVQSVQLAHNAWVCDTKLLWLHDWINRKPEAFEDGEDVECATPMHLAGANIAELPIEAFQYEHTTKTTTTTATSNITVTDHWITEEGSGDETEVYFTTHALITTTEEDSSPTTSQKELSSTTKPAATSTQPLTLTDQLTDEGFITVAVTTQRHEHSTEQGITVVHFSTQLSTQSVINDDNDNSTNESERDVTTEAAVTQQSSVERTGASTTEVTFQGTTTTTAEDKKSSLTSATTLHGLTASSTAVKPEITAPTTVDHTLGKEHWPTYTHPNEDSNESGYPRVGGSQNRMPSFAESSSKTQTIIIATSVTVMALIVVVVTAAVVRRHRKQIKRAYLRAFDYTVEASDTAFVLHDQDDPDMVSANSTLKSRSSSGSRSRSNSEGRGDQSMDTFVFEEF